MNIFLSPLAARKIEILLDFLENDCSKKAKMDFLIKLQNKFKQISKHPQSCICSKEYPNLYKCVVTKQTVFYYRVNLGEIEIINLTDNRQDPKTIFDEVTKNFNEDV